MYCAVCSPGLIPAMYAPDLFKLSETSLVLNVNASQIKQNEIINAEKTKIYKGCPGVNASEAVCKKLVPSLCPNHDANEAGKSKKVLAKIAVSYTHLTLPTICSV